MKNHSQVVMPVILHTHLASFLEVLGSDTKGCQGSAEGILPFPFWGEADAWIRGDRYGGRQGKESGELEGGSKAKAWKKEGAFSF